MRRARDAGRAHPGLSGCSATPRAGARLAVGLLWCALYACEGGDGGDGELGSDCRSCDAGAVAGSDAATADGAPMRAPVADASSRDAPAADASHRTSWDPDDPPTRDPEAASDYCESAFDALQSALPSRMADAALGDLNTLYHMARLYHGAEGAWKVTGNERIVEATLDLALATAEAGEDLDGTGYLDYCFREEDGSVGERGCDTEAEELLPTYPWRAMRGLARTLRMAVESDVAARRAEDVERLRSFLWKHVIDKWLDLDDHGPADGRRGTSTVGIQSRMVGILLDYHAATGEPVAWDIATERLEAIADNLQPSPEVDDAYWWDNWMPPREGEVADTSHSNEIVTALIEGFEAGALPYDTIHPLHRTWQRVIWDGDEEAPRFAEYVDGSGSPSARNVVIGFMRLGQYQGASQRLADRVEFSTTYDLERIEAYGHLCRIHGLARTRH